MKQPVASMPQGALNKEGSTGATNIKRMTSRRMCKIGTATLFLYVLVCCCSLLPEYVAGNEADDGDATSGFSFDFETTTPVFDVASRGKKKFGDKCESTLQCGFPGSVCDPKQKTCQCVDELPVTNHLDKCGREVAINETCFFNEQCEVYYHLTECNGGRCICRFEQVVTRNKDGRLECADKRPPMEVERYIDPAMIMVLVGMALMFIVICVVLRLFASARWRENRTIFNTPNPRLMNVSLLRESKLLHGQERRGSRMSVRVPSRQPSMASLRPHSPNPSLGKQARYLGSRRGSRGSSNASAASTRSNRSGGGGNGNASGGGTQQPQQQQQQQQQQQHDPMSVQAHISNHPVIESVTIELSEPKA